MPKALKSTAQIAAEAVAAAPTPHHTWWMSCNGCGERDNLSKGMFLTQGCQHILCKACLTKGAKSRVCPVCDRPDLHIDVINEKSPKAYLFQNPKTVQKRLEKKLKAASKAIRFHSQSMPKRTKHHKKEAEKLRAETDAMKAELAKVQAAYHRLTAMNNEKADSGTTATTTTASTIPQDPPQPPQPERSRKHRRHRHRDEAGEEREHRHRHRRERHEEREQRHRERRERDESQERREHRHRRRHRERSQEETEQRREHRRRRERSQEERREQRHRREGSQEEQETRKHRRHRHRERSEEHRHRRERRKRTEQSEPLEGAPASQGTTVLLRRILGDEYPR